MSDIEKWKADRGDVAKYWGEILPERVVQSLFPDLVSAFVPRDTPRDAVLELVVTVDDREMPTREFAEYLALIDRLYGRLSPGGLRSYSRREGRLTIAECRKSELEIIFRFAYAHPEAAAAIVILVFLRSLPNMFKITTEGLKTLAEAFKNYEEGMQIKERRDEERLTKQLVVQEHKQNVREIVEQDPALKRLDDEKKGQLTTLVGALLAEENRHLVGPIRFAKNKVKGVILKLRARQ